jgi:TPR repeat protein
MREKSTKKYEHALRLARQQTKPSRQVYDLLLAAHSNGDGQATYALATWHLFGSPFTKIDYRVANGMLRLAADKGIADAAHDLAVSYEKGLGIGKSLPRAFEYYVRAALLGDTQSYFEVGRMYFHGIGTPRNRRLAEIWIGKAEALGAEEAQQ